jgi:hypothetical protein
MILSILASHGETLPWTLATRACGTLTFASTFGTHGCGRRANSCTAKAILISPNAAGSPGIMPSGVIRNKLHKTMTGPNARWPIEATMSRKLLSAPSISLKTWASTPCKGASSIGGEISSGVSVITVTDRARAVRALALIAIKRWEILRWNLMSGSSSSSCSAQAD